MNDVYDNIKNGKYATPPIIKNNNRCCVGCGKYSPIIMFQIIVQIVARR